MFGQNSRSRAKALEINHLSRRLHQLEQDLRQAGGRTVANTSQSAGNVADVIASALSNVATRFGGDAPAFGDQAAILGKGAARMGDQALRRLSREATARPLVTLAVAAGVGLLIGAMCRRA
jgi:hypothetical protein